MSIETASPKHFSLFALQQHLRRVITFNMRETLWIRAEVADINFSRGTAYLSLVERDAYQLKAKADAVIWQRDIKKLKTKLGESLPIMLRVGQQLLMQVQVEFSEYYGLKLAIRDLDVHFTLGQLEQQRLEIWKQIQEEQLQDLNKQLELPLVPQKIAIISSKEAAGYQDFINQLQHNPYHYKFQCTLFEAAMQGAMVEKEVCAQIRNIEQQQQYFDAIVLVRGGGARLDLVAFDSFELCKAIATCELPILTGIGHEIDESLADLVAHTSLKTPTAVAEFLIAKVHQFEAQLEQINAKAQQLIQLKLQQAHTLLDTYQQKTKHLIQQQLSNQHAILEQLESKYQYLQPQYTLQRGYAMVFDAQGNRILSKNAIKTGEKLRIRLADGDIWVMV